MDLHGLAGLRRRARALLEVEVLQAAAGLLEIGRDRVLAVGEARREAEARRAHVSARDSQRRGSRGQGEVGEARHL